MKKLVLFSMITICGILDSHSYSQTIPEGSKQIFVRIFEAWSGAADSEIIIAYGNGQTEKIKLERSHPKNREQNVDKIAGVLNKITDAGYELKTSNSGGEAVHTSSYVFVKKE